MTVLIISPNSEFAAQVMARWQHERVIPAFVTLGDTRVADGILVACDMAVIGPAPSDSLFALLRSLDAAGRPALCVAPDAAVAATLRAAHSRVMVLEQQEGCIEGLVTLGSELLRCLDATTRVRAAEAALAEAQLNAALGRFMLDARHGLNNALTSILGNSELLLLEPGKLSPQVCDQVSTVHAMALRIHEVFQRFTALEHEMRIDSQSQHEIPLPPRTMLQSVSQHSDVPADQSAAH